jgi:hypothetical protein
MANMKHMIGNNGSLNHYPTDYLKSTYKTQCKVRSEFPYPNGYEKEIMKYRDPQSQLVIIKEKTHEPRNNASHEYKDYAMETILYAGRNYVSCVMNENLVVFDKNKRTVYFKNVEDPGRAEIKLPFSEFKIKKINQFVCGTQYSQLLYVDSTTSQ